MKEMIVAATDAFVVGQGGLVGLSGKDSVGNVAGFVVDRAVLQSLVIHLLRHLNETGRQAPEHRSADSVDTTECTQIAVAIGERQEGFLLLDFGPIRLPVKLDPATLRQIGAAMVQTAEVLTARPGRT